ncbi:hypothetical protein B0A49_03708 [Cryomyces minteri]|uniref:NAD(P)-binding domain-containing protein n=1 Tax=Cryomyces minteri TaxID=331657 RepID=A0A4U0XG78_9PEZI|nr:hypothetical protein B0A49_03708 [Cryomyces minteri]
MAPHILLLGGHGKVAQLLTPILLQRSWTVTSLIRNADQSDAILNLGKSKPGELNVLVRSLEEVKSDADAQSVLEVAAALMERDDTRGWYDLLDGDEDVATAVERVARERVDCIEGEDLDAIYGRTT